MNIRIKEDLKKLKQPILKDFFNFLYKEIYYCDYDRTICYIAISEYEYGLDEEIVTFIINESKTEEYKKANFNFKLSFVIGKFRKYKIEKIL